VDLDRFKLVNDAYGHEVGDRLMVQVAERMSSVAAESKPPGRAVRYGGDEFVLVVPVSGKNEAGKIAARLVQVVGQPFELGNETLHISLSAGIALNDSPDATPDELLRDADAAMYRAKAQGASAVCIFDQSMRARLSRSTAPARVRAALAKGELGLRYEPVLAVRSGDLVAVRAQLHWLDPQFGPVPQREFMPVLEETGLIIDVGTWALAEACAHARRWKTLTPGRPPLQVIVPVAGRQLAQSTFRDQLVHLLEDTGAERTQLCIAVGDSFLASEVTDGWAMLRHARALGVQVTLEAAGASRTSIADLRSARFDQVCIDASLIAGLDHDDDDTAIVEHLVSLAHMLGLIAVADNIENTSQLAVLRRLGCDRAQGPFLGVPLPASEVDLLLRSVVGAAS
jgi:diguanylate cyclase (GGDEF)-like protein